VALAEIVRQLRAIAVPSDQPDRGRPYGWWMPRPPRPQIEGGLYHVTSNSCTGRRLFRTDEDFERFFATLADVTGERSWCIRSYCLLHTHYHVLVETPSADIAAGMQFLNARYAEWVNCSREEKGHVFGARYHSVLVVREAHLWEVHRYIAMNPVRALVCARPEDWPWSSYAQVLGLRPARSFLDVRQALRDFAEQPAEARAQLRAFVEDALMSFRAEDDRAA
jgi:putative transposase